MCHWSKLTGSLGKQHVELFCTLKLRQICVTASIKQNVFFFAVCWCNFELEGITKHLMTAPKETAGISPLNPLGLRETKLFVSLLTSHYVPNGS